MSGTVLLVIGMVLCAMLIERKFTNEAVEGPALQTTILWLQPGGQRVGNQLYDAFAYSQTQRQEYIMSWRVSSVRDPDALKKSLLIL
jgi:hypothetical protein